jgi:5-methyltetrahydropteroyltriglutamate--homocysteine methyltransferase
MQLSTDRILTTHVGSLPRPQPLLALIVAKEHGEPVDEAEFERQVANAVDETVRKQSSTGIDIVSDGEMSKPSYTLYIRHRATNIVLDPSATEKGRDVMIGRDLLDHPDFGTATGFHNAPFPACKGPLRYTGQAALERDLATFKEAVARTKPRDAFVTAPSPGILTRFVLNHYYRSEDDYVEALAELIRTEYEAIVRAGFLLQIDCPDLGSARNNQHRDKTDEEFLRIADRNVEALNHAIRDLPPERMRMHVCWGNYEGPHNHDIPLSKIIHLCFKARPIALSFEGANPRHEHEWEDLEEIRIPDDRILIPGVIDSTTNFVEHPRLVAQRICRYANIVGRDRVVAGVDCGFGTNATSPNVATSIVWSKLAALAEGATLATKRLC